MNGDRYTCWRSWGGAGCLVVALAVAAGSTRAAEFGELVRAYSNFAEACTSDASGSGLSPYGWRIWNAGATPCASSEIPVARFVSGSSEIRLRVGEQLQLDRLQVFALDSRGRLLPRRGVLLGLENANQPVLDLDAFKAGAGAPRAVRTGLTYLHFTDPAAQAGPIAAAQVRVVVEN